MIPSRRTPIGASLRLLSALLILSLGLPPKALALRTQNAGAEESKTNGELRTAMRRAAPPAGPSRLSALPRLLPPTELEERVYLPLGEGKRLAYTRIHSEKAGPKPAVLMLHGFGQSKEDEALKSIGRRLAQEGNEVVLVDLRNQATSKNWNESSGSFRTFSHKDNLDDLGPLLKELQQDPSLDLGRTVLIGHSYGGFINRRAAEWLSQDSRFSSVKIQAIVELAGMIDGPGSFYLFLASMLETDSERSHRLLNRIPGRLLSPFERAGLAFELWKQEGFLPISDQELRYWLPELDKYSAAENLKGIPSSIPYLYVIGERDFLISGYPEFPAMTAFKKALEERGAPSRLWVLPGVEHQYAGEGVPPEVLPPLANGIAQFLAQHVPSAAGAEEAEQLAEDLKRLEEELKAVEARVYAGLAREKSWDLSPLVAKAALLVRTKKWGEARELLESLDLHFGRAAPDGERFNRTPQVHLYFSETISLRQQFAPLWKQAEQLGNPDRLQEIVVRVLGNQGLRADLKRDGWVPVDAKPIRAMGFKAAGAFILADSARDPDPTQMILSENGLGNKAVEKLLAWIQAGDDAPEVIHNARLLNARKGRDLVVLKKTPKLSVQDVQKLLGANGIEGLDAVRTVIGDVKEVENLPIFAFQLLAGENNLPAVVVLNIAVRFQDEAGDFYTLVVMA